MGHVPVELLEREREIKGWMLPGILGSWTLKGIKRPFGGVLLSWAESLGTVGWTLSLLILSGS